VEGAAQKGIAGFEHNIERGWPGYPGQPFISNKRNPQIRNPGYENIPGFVYQILFQHPSQLHNRKNDRLPINISGQLIYVEG
jgi:hypothetical protein